MKTSTYYYIFIFTLIALALSQTIDYRQLYTTGPACEQGRLQSPINLLDYNSRFNSSINVVYENYQSIPNANLIFNGRTLAINQASVQGYTPLSNFGYASVVRGGVLKQYILTRIEVNYPGEHQVEGQQPDLEVKLIHEMVLPFQSAVNQYRGLSDGNTDFVVSILFKTSSTISDNGFLSDMLSTWSGFSLTTNFIYRSSYTLNIDSYGLLRDRPFFFYEGSFTHSPCDETVNNIVIRDMFYISKDNLNSFATIFANYYSGPVANKPIAEYFGRNVYRNYMNYTESLTGSYMTINSLFIYGLALVAFLLF